MMQPRAREIRDACLARLAVAAGLPVPTDEEAAQLGAETTLDEAWRRWQAVHPAASGGAVVPASANLPARRTWVSRRRRWIGAGLATATLAVFAAGLAAERHRSIVGAAAGTIVAPTAERWTAVTDASRASLATKLLAMSGSDVPLSGSLSASELAVLLFGPSQPRQHARLDSLDARIDSVLWVRGRVHGGSHFEIGARVVVVRPRRAELRVARAVIDGVELPVAAIRPGLATIQSGAAAPGTRAVWFEVPRRIANVRLDGGVARITTRATP